MTLIKIADLYPDYKEEIFGGDDIKKFSVYSDDAEKIGSVHDVLVDEGGRFRYFVVNTGFLGFGKKILFPVGLANMDYDRDRIHLPGFTKEQAENLPEYNDDMTIDYNYEERVRKVYRLPTPNKTLPDYDLDNYSYDYEPDFYEMNAQNHQQFKLYEERLVANKERFKTGTVTVGKRIATETAKVSVPIEKERVIVERMTPSNTTPIAPDATAFQEGEVFRMEVYEETANVQKQTFVREEVKIRKEIENETVEVQETIRREELEVDTDGKPIINENR
ncbi:MAG: DUF2382 domain-containing protein [Hydrococcus sp. Prado102]|jgi:uncharacterized protein (TIGR02271 family)|nr:DUF2382 domain-containing protein [Hydrococcus sp. Prado102]